MTSADLPADASSAGGAGAGAIRPGRHLDVPLYPGAAAPLACPRGHEIRAGAVQFGYHGDYAARELLCEICHALPGRQGRWALIDPAAQVFEDGLAPTRLQAVAIRPLIPAGAGMIQLRWGTTIYGQVELSLCRTDNVALLLGLHVEPLHRRRGVGRVLVAAARTRGHGYRWSANPPDTGDPVTAAFWARIGAPPAPARPCSHQRDAGIDLDPRWPRWA